MLFHFKIICSFGGKNRGIGLGGVGQGIGRHSYSSESKYKNYFINRLKLFFSYKKAIFALLVCVIIFFVAFYFFHDFFYGHEASASSNHNEFHVYLIAEDLFPLHLLPRSDSVGFQAYIAGPLNDGHINDTAIYSIDNPTELVVKSGLHLNVKVEFLYTNPSTIGTCHNGQKLIKG